MKLYLVRHGATGKPEKLQVKSDGLNEFGLSQVESAADFLAGDKKIALILSSPYMRAVQTASSIAKRLNVPLEQDERLIEIPLWLTPGDLHDDSAREYKEALDILSSAQVGIGVLLEELRTRFEHNESVVLVCHGNIIRAILAYAIKMSLESVVRIFIDNGSITLLKEEVDQDGRLYYGLRYLNRT